METELADGRNQVDDVGAETDHVDAGGQAVEPRPTSESSIDEVDRLLDQVEGALARLDDGTYGTCAGCGGTIEDAFLAGSPTTRTCEACTSPTGD